MTNQLLAKHLLTAKCFKVILFLGLSSSGVQNQDNKFLLTKAMRIKDCSSFAIGRGKHKRLFTQSESVNSKFQSLESQITYEL